MSNDTSQLTKYVVIVAAVAIFAISINDWNPSAPTVAGYSTLQTTMQADPFNNTPSWPNFGNYTDTFTGNYTCTPDVAFFGLNCISVFFDWVVGAIFWIGGAFLWLIVSIGTALWFLGLFLWWLGSLVVAFFGALLGTATLTFDGMPIQVQALMWVIILPMLVFIVFLILRYIRGQS
ncbi:MAG TPA: hypothetical protein VFF51_04195 [Candidatus Methylomirabilis sp.]|nr:hypothetical protein [Candidatus Methylomirabilis sp.]